MSVTTKKVKQVKIPAKLGELAEFRYRLRRILSFSEVASEAAGISAQQYQLLQVIASVPAELASSITYVAERMMLKHNSAVELIDRAELCGLVRRVADENDHRRSLLEITERGGELLARLVGEHLTEIEAEGPEMMRTLQRLISGRPGAIRKSAER